MGNKSSTAKIIKEGLSIKLHNTLLKFLHFFFPKISVISLGKFLKDSWFPPLPGHHHPEHHEQVVLPAPPIIINKATVVLRNLDEINASGWHEILVDKHNMLLICAWNCGSKWVQSKEFRTKVDLKEFPDNLSYNVIWWWYWQFLATPGNGAYCPEPLEWVIQTHPKLVYNVTVVLFLFQVSSVKSKGYEIHVSSFLQQTLDNLATKQWKIVDLLTYQTAKIHYFGEGVKHLIFVS